MRIAGRLLAAAALLAAPCVARAGAVTVRTGDHTDFGRVVFDVSAGQTDSETRTGDQLEVTFAGAGAVASARGTRNVMSVEGAQNSAVLTLAPGSRTHVWRVSGRLVIDVFASGPAAQAARAALPAVPGAAPAAVHGHTGNPGQAGAGALRTAAGGPGRGGRAGAGAPADARTQQFQPASGAAPVPPVPGRAPEMLSNGALEVTLVPLDPLSPPKPAARPAASAPAGPPPPAAPAAASEPGTTVATDGLIAERLPSAPAGEDAFIVPFDRDTGAATFTRGGRAHVVFDEGKPIDLAALKDDPLFGGLRVTLLPVATELSLPVPAGKRVRLRRQRDGWVISVGPGGGFQDAAPVSLHDGVLLIEQARPASTLVLADRETGERLLVGTVHDAGLPVGAVHRSPEFALLPSWVGVVVAAQSDRLALRVVKAGFTLQTESAPKLAAYFSGAADQALADSAALTRHFDFVPLTLPELLARMQGDVGVSASSPKLGRLRPRLRAAQDMLALGLDREAAGLLRVAIDDDPAGAQNADAAALLAMATWLGGGKDQAAAALLPADTDETALWRALMQTGGPGGQAAAATLAANWRLLLAYPGPLRARLLPAVAASLVEGGQTKEAAALLARITDAGLDEARAALLVKQGKQPEALALLDKLSLSSDRRRAAMAARQAVEVRLAGGQLDAGGAAAALMKQLYAWRDDEQEPTLRLRIGALQAQAGQWRDSLRLLRESEAVFPGRRDQFRAAERSVLADLLRPGAANRVAPLDLVALTAENADLLADKDSFALAPVLADKLLALDLPDRAAPVLDRLMRATAAGEARAGLGTRLAELHLDQGDTAGVAAALDASDAQGLPAALSERRALVRARALAADGKGDSALQLLAQTGGPAALTLRADILERRKDWAAEVGVLKELARTQLPASGALSVAQQDLVLRLASAAAQAGDMAVMQELQAGPAQNLSPGPRLELFRALSAQPIQSLVDLPRSGQEAEAAHALPAELAAYPAR